MVSNSILGGRDPRNLRGPIPGVSGDLKDKLTSNSPLGSLQGSNYNSYN